MYITANPTWPPSPMNQRFNTVTSIIRVGGRDVEVVHLGSHDLLSAKRIVIATHPEGEWVCTYATECDKVVRYIGTPPNAMLIAMLDDLA